MSFCAVCIEIHLRFIEWPSGWKKQLHRNWQQKVKLTEISFRAVCISPIISPLSTDHPSWRVNNQNCFWNLPFTHVVIISNLSLLWLLNYQFIFCVCKLCVPPVTVPKRIYCTYGNNIQIHSHKYKIMNWTKTNKCEAKQIIPKT